MKPKKVKTFSELKELLDGLLSKGYIFRGISKDDQLLPKLLQGGKDYSNKELALLAEFEKYYGLFSHANNYWEFLSIAQHYGLMTRLIDFSANPYVALFFSTYNPARGKEGCYKIYAIAKNKLKGVKTALRQEGTLFVANPDDSFCAILGSAFETLKQQPGDPIYIVKPSFRTSRIFAQQGLFVVPSILEKDRILNTFKKKARVIVIPEDIRKKAKKYLEKIGFDEAHLMQDLASVCSDLNSRVRYLKQKTSQEIQQLTIATDEEIDNIFR